eukprot:11671275-Ditylum_brightwellii.AAC.1
MALTRLLLSHCGSSLKKIVNQTLPQSQDCVRLNVAAHPVQQKYKCAITSERLLSSGGAWLFWIVPSSPTLSPKPHEISLLNT